MAFSETVTIDRLSVACNLWCWEHHEPRGDGRPRLSGGAQLRICRFQQKAVELCSTLEPEAVASNN